MNDRTSLARLNVIALDCQATGANPDKGRLLEIGWTTGRAARHPAGGNTAVQSCLIQMPAGTSIPVVVQRLTGISDADMAHAVAENSAWTRLEKTAGTVAAHNRAGLCPLVIHYARFEVPFLRSLHATCNPDAPFPFHIICTHEIARRVLPDLPRRGIRALAGYLGHALPELKRSAGHAVATLVIWQALVALLQQRCGIDDLAQLTRWLASRHAPRSSGRIYPMDPEKRLGLPDKPGVYRMRRADGGILYIGKARSLKKRVSSYFRAKAPHAEHILEMLTQARDIDFSPAGSALEAAVRESDEIKSVCPPYNKALRPDRRSLVYCSRDLEASAAHCDGRFRIGPLPAGRLVDALAAFAAWLTDHPGRSESEPETMGRRILALPPSLAPEQQSLEQGLELFRSNYRKILQNRSALRIVTSTGAQLWRRRLEAMDASGEDMDQQNREAEGNPKSEEETDGGRSDWDPEDIVAAVESMLMRAALMIRRARWYGLLVESCLAWTAADDPKGSRNLIVIDNGSISHRTILLTSRKIPVPERHDRSWHARRRCFDIAAYDRMRIITTELRRLVSEGREIEVCLTPKTILTSSQLKRSLRWV